MRWSEDTRGDFPNHGQPVVRIKDRSWRKERGVGGAEGPALMRER